ncbi:hypothetical protein X798_05902 [Onchocerca flexuosa]|uniref:Phospholipase A2-like central domain-containing protein n=1 Tax=Onchocerca flexuosa TaxID=387005 RepID=A0A238BNZ5_9BILA|nr:hypothetical protein X798_05902 [Onchocerca flexuosa]
MCCMKHDLCYDKAVFENRCYDTAEEYLLPYHWKCVQNQTVCLNDENSKCGNALCACDTEVINCWKRFEKPKIDAKCDKTNHSHIRYPHSSFNFLSLIKKIFNMWKREFKLQQ